MTNNTVMNRMLVEDKWVSAGCVRIVKATLGVDRVIGIVSKLIILLSTIILMVLLGANIAARYAFHEGGIEWAAELPAQLFPWLIAGGIVIAVQRGAHIAVDFAFSLISERAGRILTIGIYLVVVIAYTALFSVVWDVANIVSVERSPLLGIPNSWGYYALMYGVSGTALCSLTILIRVCILGKAAVPQPNPEESPL